MIFSPNTIQFAFVGISLNFLLFVFEIYWSFSGFIDRFWVGVCGERDGGCGSTPQNDWSASRAGSTWWNDGSCASMARIKLRDFPPSICGSNFSEVLALALLVLLLVAWFYCSNGIRRRICFRCRLASNGRKRFGLCPCWRLGWCCWKATLQIV